MPSTDENRELLASLKQDESNARRSNESRETKEHIAGKSITWKSQPRAAGKLASAIAQQQGESDLSKGSRDVARQVEPHGPVDRDTIQQSLHALAEAKTKQQFGEDPERVAAGSEASRLQSAAEQYDLAHEGKQRKMKHNLGGE
ncbi:AdoMet-dependent rRNA methyltransferase spb1 [Hypoxylon texense]